MGVPLFFKIVQGPSLHLDNYRDSWRSTPSGEAVKPQDTKHHCGVFPGQLMIPMGQGHTVYMMVGTLTGAQGQQNCLQYGKDKR